MKLTLLAIFVYSFKDHLSIAFPIKQIKSKPFINNPFANSNIRMYSTSQQHASTANKKDESTATQKKSPSDMKISEIKSELRSLQVGYADCFDKESLIEKLGKARSGALKGKPVEEPSKTTQSSPSCSKFDRDAVATELRSLRVAELRTQLASRNIRWGNMVEKEELVQALLNAKEKESEFSVSGTLAPGKVGELTDKSYKIEVEQPSSTPLLLDVYATWCGPCKIMAQQMEEAAQELGGKIRMAKLDSDKYDEIAASLRVQGLPTLVLFDKNGKMISRKEGALMKSDLLSWIKNEAF